MANKPMIANFAILVTNSRRLDSCSIQTAMDIGGGSCDSLRMGVT
jgi:hypothetical protein